MTGKQNRKRGRPRKYETPEALQKVIDAYFNKNKRYPTVCGLALALGFAQRKSLLDYEGYEGDFCNLIKKAVSRVEASYERDLRTKGIKPTGSIFALKNMGWKDEHNHEVRVDGLKELIEVIDGRSRGLPDGTEAENTKVSG